MVSRSCRAALIAAAFLAAGPAAAAGARGPEAVPDVVGQVIDTVVLISTSEKIPDGAGTPPPDLGPDSDLDQFFKNYFDRQRRGDQGERPTGEGSGFVIDANGTIVTNFHVVEDADRIEVGFNDGSKLPATVVGRDKDTDIAILKVTAPRKLAAVRFGDSDKLRLGEWVIAMGNPFGIGLSASAGIVSGRNRNIRNGPYDEFIQTDAAINKGNSGGPLFNLAGEVIGMDTAILSPTGSSVGIGFAVPSNEMGPVIAQIERYGAARRGYIGVRVEDVPPELATRLGLADGAGALAAEAVAGGPAAQAGVKAGDVFTRFDGKPVADARTLQRLVGDAGIDRDVTAEIRRDGKTVQLRIHLVRQEAKPAPTPAAPAGTPPAVAAVAVLGLDLAQLDGDLRSRFHIVPSVEAGAVILAVAPTSPLKSLGLGVGDIIVEVDQQRIASPDDFRRRLTALKGRQAQALALIANAAGAMRFVRIPVQ